MNSAFCAATLIEHQGITWIQACDAGGSAHLHRSEVEIPQPITVGEELPPDPLTDEMIQNWNMDHWRDE